MTTTPYSVLNFIIGFSLLISFSCITQETPLIADGAELKVVANTYSFTEGPAMAPNGDVYFTDQPNDRILKWSATDNSVSVFMEPSGRSNGLYFDNEGNLLACADDKNQLWQIDPNKKVTVLIDDYKGKKLNGPNDLWVDKKGGIYFTDPYYQRDYWTRTEMELEKQQVYYLSPNKKNITVVADNLQQPNGIIGSADGKTLYVADVGDNKTYSYRVNTDGSLSDKTLFTNLGSDGMTLDNKGNVYLTGKGVIIFNKEGEKIHHIPIDQNWTANVTFGGKEQKTLFITAMNSVYTLEMNVKGVR
ncbi:SMP-30/gluconolactonase/LRE family protein [Arenibacter latericius]|uniref:SMP-30/gluconolactonase/LRE family protein n=1 Tax=Arenibacter latericius TaxID=86104 RepID=UPI0004294E74|nr:SMP-30/gluconolactonase/LRE family protein [Arenibacter latericius]